VRARRGRSERWDARAGAGGRQDLVDRWDGRVWEISVIRLGYGAGVKPCAFLGSFLFPVAHAVSSEFDVGWIELLVIGFFVLPFAFRFHFCSNENREAQF